MPRVVFIGDVAPPAPAAPVPAPQGAGTYAGLDVFRGCERRTEIAAFLAALAVERQIRGAAIGFVVGALACGGLYLWAKSEGKL